MVQCILVRILNRIAIYKTRGLVPLFYTGEQMTDDVWIKTNEEKLRSLIADEAKQIPILNNLEASIRQLKSKQTFRLALLNQLLEDTYKKE